MEIKRISKWSDMTLVKEKDIEDFLKEKSRIGATVIQVVSENGIFIIEFVHKDLIEEYREEQSPKFKTDKVEYIEELKTKEDKELESALDTIFTNDPLRKYSGCKLRDMFDNHDAESINWYLNNLHNKYICDKIKLIVESGYSR